MEGPLSTAARGSRHEPLEPLALYERHGDLLTPTPNAHGPWFDDVQHGAAIAALMGRAVEQAPASVPMQLAQLSIDMTRRVPMTAVRTEVEVLRDGKRVQALALRLLADDREVSRATAVRMRVVDGIASGPFVGVPYDVDKLPPPPEAGTPDNLDHDNPNSLFKLFETRTIGDHSTGHSCWWLRFVGEIVRGEPLTPTTRLCVTADLVRSTATIMNTKKYLTVNPDLTILPHRLPEGEWICLDSYARAEHNGVGQSDGVIFDRRGRCGRSLKSQLIDPR